MHIIILTLLFVLVIYILLLIFKQTYKRRLSIPIYYINLDKSENRRNTLMNQFKRYNIRNYKRISGVTPDIIEETNKQLFKNTCSYQTEIEFACLLSHLKSIHTAYINRDEYALILEDDIIIHRMVNYENLLKTTPEDWEILQLHVLNANLYDKDKDLWIPYTDLNWSTAAYLLNRKGMINVLSACFTNYDNPNFENLQINWDTLSKIQPCVSDFIIYQIAKTYSCNDLLFRTPTVESTIHNDHLPTHKLHEDKTLEYFINNGYKNKSIGYTIM